MKKSDLEVGKTYTYYPPQLESDNLHFLVTVESIAARVKVRLSDDRTRWISAKRLQDQIPLIPSTGEPAKEVA